MKDSAGLPVGVQVVAGPWREESILEVMEGY
jgi:Asp-tRNA(Asn)/Glu-tRNA(Gln) amidotransferase A subunit family amidase